MKKCPYCKAQFTPNPRVGERQITCGKPACKAALKSDNNRKWRQRNPDYHRDYYPQVKDWLEQKPGYLKKSGKAIRNMWKKTGMHRGCVTNEKSSVLIYKPS